MILLIGKKPHTGKTVLVYQSYKFTDQLNPVILNLLGPKVLLKEFQRAYDFNRKGY